MEDTQEEDHEGDKAVGHEEEEHEERHVGQSASVQADSHEVVEVLEGQHAKKNFLST